MDSTSGILYLVLLALLAFSAFFSASETAYSSLNKIRMKNYADAGNRKARRALYVADDFDRLLSTILVGNNVVNMASASIATVVATAMFGASGAAVATVVMTVLVLIFGEILPKTLAKENSENIAMAAGGLLSFLIKLLSPIVFFFVKIKELALRLVKGPAAQPSVTEEELKYIVESIEQEGVLEEQESDLVQSALDFDEITAQEILTPRVDLVTLDVEDSIDEALKVVLDAHYSRIPVYRGTVDLSLIHISVETAFCALPSAALNEKQTKMFLNGVRLDIGRVACKRTGDTYAVYAHDRRFLGVARERDGLLCMQKLFTLEV